MPLQKKPTKKAATAKFFLDLSEPLRDQIIELDNFEKFLHDEAQVFAKEKLKRAPRKSWIQRA